MFSLELIMSADPVTVSPSTTLDDAIAIMQDHNFRHLPVVDRRGVLVGLLTQSDVLAATDSILRDRENRLPVTQLPVEDVMVTRVMTVDVVTSLRGAAKLIEKHKIGCLPVLQGDRVVGIITDSDFVAVAINLLEQLEDSEPDEEAV
ncbi:MAG: CBS domain-containing protein [Gammaproteobacteria bacterium]